MKNSQTQTAFIRHFTNDSIYKIDVLFTRNYYQQNEHLEELFSSHFSQSQLCNFFLLPGSQQHQMVHRVEIIKNMFQGDFFLFLFAVVRDSLKKINFSLKM